MHCNVFVFRALVRWVDGCGCSCGEGLREKESIAERVEYQEEKCLLEENVQPSFELDSEIHYREQHVMDNKM